MASSTLNTTYIKQMIYDKKEMNEWRSICIYLKQNNIPSVFTLTIFFKKFSGSSAPMA